MNCKNKLFITKKRAFTLIELLIVIAIIGILFIVLVSKVDFATDKAKATGVQTDFRSFQVAIETVAKEHAGLATFGWDTGDINGDRIRNSYDKGDINKNGKQDPGEVFVGSKTYGETWTNVYTLTNPADANDTSAIAALEEAINKNLDPKLHITINDDLTINMANGAKDPWDTEYHGYYITNATVDHKDRGAIVMYSNGANQEFGSEHSIANGIVTITVPGNNKLGADDYSIAVVYTYTNGYGEVKTTTSGFSNNQNFGVTSGDVNQDDVIVNENPNIEHEDVVIENATYYDASEGVWLTTEDPFPETAGDGDIYLYEDFEYRYNYVYVYMHDGFDETTGDPIFMDYGWLPTSVAIQFDDFYASSYGWGVAVRDRTQTSYTHILNAINEEPVVHFVSTFANCDNLANISVSLPNNAKHSVMMFVDCNNLETVVVNIPESTISTQAMFQFCTKLKDASRLIIPSTLQNTSHMFHGCTSLVYPPNMKNASGVKEARSMFYECKQMSQTPNISNMTSLTNAIDMFSQCFSLTKVPDLSKLTRLRNANSMFAFCYNLTGSTTLSCPISFASPYEDEDGNYHEALDQNGMPMTDHHYMFWMCGEIEITMQSLYGYDEYTWEAIFNPGGNYNLWDGPYFESGVGENITVKINN